MDFKEFADKILKRYPPKKEQETDKMLMNDWLRAINIPGEFNYDNAFLDLMRTYAYNCMPSPKVIVEVLEMNRLASEKPSKATFKSLYADKNGNTYCFGVEPNVGEIETTRRLTVMGYTNIRPLTQYLKEMAKA